VQTTLGIIQNLLTENTISTCLRLVWLQHLSADHARTTVLLPNGAHAGAALCLLAWLKVNANLRILRVRLVCYLPRAPCCLVLHAREQRSAN
jgi:hypothetical protein